MGPQLNNTHTSEQRVSKWLEREFEFSNPAELYPNLRVRLRGTPARIADLLQNCSHEVLVRKPERKWSAQEHVGHLLDIEPLTLTRVNDFIRRVGELTKADFTNKVTDQANYNTQRLSEILIAFREARLATVEALRCIEPEVLLHSLSHPRLNQEMHLVDYLYLVAEHDDHHLASIWQLISPH